MKNGSLSAVRGAAKILKPVRNEEKTPNGTTDAETPGFAAQQGLTASAFTEKLPGLVRQ
jgi:hypothetical protein